MATKKRKKNPRSSAGNDKPIRVPVIEEQLRVSKRVRPSQRVSVRVKPIVRKKTVEVPVAKEEVRVVRVPINRVVETSLPQRQEGDTTIIPVFEEELIVTKQLVLKEEIRITRVRTTHEARRKVSLRTEEVHVTRSPCNRSGYGTSVARVKFPRLSASGTKERE